MATAAVSTTLVNGTANSATPVNANFTDLVTFLNNSVIHRDGSKAFAGNVDMGSNKVTLLANGTVSTDAVNKGQMDTAISAAVTAATATVRSWYALTSGTDQIGITTSATDITGLSVTWTADPARLYKVSLNVNVSTSVAQTPTISITDGSGTVKKSGNVTTPVAAGSAQLHLVWIESGLSGSQTRKGRGSVASGTLTIVNSSNRNGVLVVEDIGAA
jgi:trimeric autotransporter adhesin